MMSGKFISSVWILLIALFIPGASPPTADEGGDEEDLLFGESEMVITPARHNLTVSDAPASVTVITEEEIASSGAQTLADLFREVPGLEVFAVSAVDVNVCARGNNATMSNKMLVMLDGRSVYEDFFGFVVWKTIPVSLNNIKQIEIVRSPGSAVYGANAYNGVIHILTKSPREMTGSSFEGRYGLEGEQHAASMTRAGRIGKTDYKGWFSWKDVGFLGNQENEPDSDNNESMAGSVTLARAVGNRSEISFHADMDDGDGEMESGIGNILYENRIINTEIKYQSPETSVRAYWKHSEDMTYNQSSLDSEGMPDERDVLTNMFNVDLQTIHSGLCEAYWVMGGNVRYHSIRSGFMNDWHDQLLSGAYLQMEKTLFQSTDLTVGGRLDHHPHTDFHFTPRVSLVHRFEGRRYLRLSAGEAYRNPTFIENYLYIASMSIPGSPLPAEVVGNEDMKPERIRSIEAAVGTPIRSNAFLRLEGFWNDQKDWADFGVTDYYPGTEAPKTLSYTNTHNVKSRGGETSLQIQWTPSLTTDIGYSYIWCDKNETLPVDMVFVPAHKLNARVTTRPFNSWRGSVSARYRSEASFYRDDTGTIPEHTVADCALQYMRNNDQFVIELSVRNIADLRYREYPIGDAFARKIVMRVFYHY